MTGQSTELVILPSYDHSDIDDELTMTASSRWLSKTCVLGMHSFVVLDWNSKNSKKGSPQSQISTLVGLAPFEKDSGCGGRYLHH